jgi:hypothetical protein
MEGSAPTSFALHILFNIFLHSLRIYITYVPLSLQHLLMVPVGGKTYSFRHCDSASLGLQTLPAEKYESCLCSCLFGL